MANYGLRAFASIKQGQGYFGSIADIAQNWSRSKRWLGGDWQGSFRLELPIGDLQQWFYEALDYHIEEKVSNLITWEGSIYEMDLTMNGVTRRRSLDTLSNAVKTRYASDANVVTETAFAETQASINRYGRKEEMLVMDGYPVLSAEARRDAVLAEHSWPWPRSISYGRANKPVLEVRTCGYVFKANYRYVTAQDGTHVNLSTWINTILTTDCAEWLSVGKIQTNTLQVKCTLNIPQRAWDTIAELCGLGDGTLPWRMWVGPGRKVYYEPVATAPQYFWMQQGLQNSVGDGQALSAYRVVPAVVRDQTYPNRRSDPGSFLTDVRDSLIEEVHVDGSGQLDLRSLDVEEAEILAKAQDYRHTAQPYHAPIGANPE